MEATMEPSLQNLKDMHRDAVNWRILAKNIREWEQQYKPWSRVLPYAWVKLALETHYPMMKYQPYPVSEASTRASTETEADDSDPEEDIALATALVSTSLRGPPRGGLIISPAPMPPVKRARVDK